MKKTRLFLMVLLCAGWMTSRAECQDGPYGLKINGSTTVEAPEFGDPDMQGRKQYKASCVDLKAGDEVVLANLSCDATWMVDLDPYGEYESFDGGKAAGKLTCKKDGKYDFYIKLSVDAGDLVYVGPAENCDGPTPDPGYSGSVPAKCPDVMLQAFYWESYQDPNATGSATKVYGRTKWADFKTGKASDGTTTLAEEMGQWFDLIWLPPMSSSSGGVGYHPIQYSNLKSAWGEQRNLKLIINTFHENGARVVADIVINHAEGQNGWCDFAEQNFGTYGKFTPKPSWICKTDEMNSESKKDEAGYCFGKATGANDDGYGDEANYPDARDWDHTSTDVQNMFKAYLKWLRGEMEIDGFRYDYCKGYNNGHINDYNRAAEAYYSVMEFWDGNPSTLQYHLNEAGWNTQAFDFATKYTAFNDGIARDNYCGLKGAGLLGAGKGRYACTFLDSHDSFLRNDGEFCGNGKSMTDCKDKVLQAYAYMLSMPGVPCVFWPHWVALKEPIKAMINARYKAGVHSESSVSDDCGNGYYKATITGTNGQICLFVGPNSDYGNTPSGFTLASKGVNYAVYYKMNSTRGNKNEERQPIMHGIDQVNTQTAPRGEKFIRNGQLFIRVGEKVYDITGKLTNNE